jgi:hypothetical protein
MDRAPALTSPDAPATAGLRSWLIKLAHQAHAAFLASRHSAHRHLSRCGLAAVD